MSLPRILLAMGRDGLIPAAFFNSVHTRFKTPWKGAVLCGALIVPIAALLPLSIVASLAIMAVLFGYAVVCAAVLVLRRTHSQSEPAFRAPLGPLVPLIGMSTCLLLM